MVDERKQGIAQMVKRIGSIEDPFSIPSQLEPTLDFPVDSYATLLRLHVILQGHLLIPRKFLLLNKGMLRLSLSNPQELQDFMTHAPLYISDPDKYGNDTFEKSVQLAFEMDSPDFRDLKKDDIHDYAERLDEWFNLESPQNVSIDIEPLAREFRSRFRDCSKSYSDLANPRNRDVMDTLDDLAELASQRLGRRETKVPGEVWSHNDIALVIKDRTFHKNVPSERLAKLLALKSEILDCSRHAYLLGLTGQFARKSEQVAVLNTSGQYDFSGSVLQLNMDAQAKPSDLATRLSLLPKEMNLNGLERWEWSSIDDFIHEDKKAKEYFIARRAALAGYDSLNSFAYKAVDYLHHVKKQIPPSSVIGQTLSIVPKVNYIRKENAVAGVVFSIATGVAASATVKGLHWLLAAIITGGVTSVASKIMRQREAQWRDSHVTRFNSPLLSPDIVSRFDK